MILANFSRGQEVWNTQRKVWVSVVDYYHGFGTVTYEFSDGTSEDEGYLRVVPDNKLREET